MTALDIGSFKTQLPSAVVLLKDKKKIEMFQNHIVGLSLALKMTSTQWLCIRMKVQYLCYSHETISIISERLIDKLS